MNGFCVLYVLIKLSNSLTPPTPLLFPVCPKPAVAYVCSISAFGDKSTLYAHCQDELGYEVYSGEVYPGKTI